jgi:hypothetical protein
MFYTKHLNKLPPGGGLHEMTEHVAGLCNIQIVLECCFLFVNLLMSCTDILTYATAYTTFVYTGVPP